MNYLICIFSLSLCFFYDPLYNNYTSLLNGPYHFLYVLWIAVLTLYLFKNIIRHAPTQREKILICLLGFFFILGSYLPYYSPFYLFSFLHVFLPLLSIILYLLYIFLIIFRHYKKEPSQAQILYQWYFWGLSLISLLIIFFGHINGICEIATVYLTIFLIEKIKIIDDS